MGSSSPFDYSAIYWKELKVVSLHSNFCTHFPSLFAEGLNAASISQREPEITPFCFRFSRTSAKLT